MNSVPPMPAWNDTSYSVLIRAAAYLTTHVTPGGTVPVEQMAHDLAVKPATLQRRLRELTERGWDVRTVRTDPSVPVGQIRFHTPGDPPWAPSTSPSRSNRRSVSQAVFARDGYRCIDCGATAAPADAATLLNVMPVTDTPDPSSVDDYVTVCRTCRFLWRTRSAAGEHPWHDHPTVDAMCAAIDELTATQRGTLMLALTRGYLPADPVRDAFYQAVTSPPRVRQQVQEHLLHAVLPDSVGTD